MNRKRLAITIGIVVAVVVIAVVLDAMLSNHQPTITILKAEPSTVLRSGTSQIVCNATDRDGDELIYGWSATAGQITGEGATVTWKAPYTEGSYNITVLVSDSRGGVATGHVTVRVRTNKAPTISSLVANADWTLSAGSLQVTCNATDRDFDELSYEWTTTGGSISGSGAVANWTAPQEVGVYNITVIVSDGYGGSDTASLPVTVVRGQPPTIEKLEITKERYGHCYLKPYSGGYYVGKGQMYDIECFVADASSKLSYQWSCDAGQISGEGSMITWTAPNESRKVTVTVVVADIAGNMASKNLVLNVVDCSTCTFGSCT